MQDKSNTRPTLTPDPGLTASRMVRLADTARAALVALREELPDAERALRDAAALLVAWDEIVDSVGACGDESPAEIAAMVREEAAAVRDICDSIDIPRETSPKHVPGYVVRAINRGYRHRQRDEESQS